MDHSSDPALASKLSYMAEKIKEEHVRLRVNRWKAKQVKVPNDEIAIQLAGLCFDYSVLPGGKRGCLLPDPAGGYVYVPYSDEYKKDDLPADLLERVNTLEAITNNHKNLPVLRQVDKLMEDEVNDTCFWEFLDGGDASQIDFQGKVKILARYRLMKEGIDVSPNDAANPMFEFVVVNVDEFGGSKMKHNRLAWTGHYEEIMERVEAFTRPSFRIEDVVPKMIRALNAIQHGEKEVEEAKALIAKLKVDSFLRPGGPRWTYFMCNKNEELRKKEERAWTRLESADHFKMMRRRAREQGRLPVIVRPWQFRHHDVCNLIRHLQERQIAYCGRLEHHHRRENAAAGSKTNHDDDQSDTTSVHDLLSDLASGEIRMPMPGGGQSPLTEDSGADGDGKGGGERMELD